jgi:alcohol dehydrogenase class IV
MDFEFATAHRIIFGRGRLDAVAPSASEMGRRAFVVTGRIRQRADPLLAQLNQHGIETVTFSVPSEPTTETALDGVRKARQAGSDLVIGIGGGSAIDTGKVIAAMLTNAGELEDYLEVIGRGQALQTASAPYIAVPTTAGTGAEVTRNAVIGSPRHRIKVSMRSPLMLPVLAVVDPLLTLSMSRVVTASTGLDALTQLIEAYTSNRANPLTDGICREGLIRAARSLRKAYHDADDVAAREDMSAASLFGGLALANAKLGAVHGFAGPLGGRFSSPHGSLCARLLPEVIEANVCALESRAPDSEALLRYQEVAAIVTGDDTAKAAHGVKWIRELCQELEVPPLSQLGISEADLPLAVEESKNASSMKGNPITLTDDELARVLTNAL